MKILQKENSLFGHVGWASHQILHVHPLCLIRAFAVLWHKHSVSGQQRSLSDCVYAQANSARIVCIYIF